LRFLQQLVERADGIVNDEPLLEQMAIVLRDAARILNERTRQPWYGQPFRRAIVFFAVGTFGFVTTGEGTTPPSQLQGNALAC
jgi:hypothetical protein